MKKTDKKIDNAIRQALTEACDIALEQHEGFNWLTHIVNYNCFPRSLAIVCVFDTNAQLEKTDVDGLRMLIKKKLASIHINLNDICQHVNFDTEENCNDENNGNWQQRLENARGKN